MTRDGTTFIRRPHCALSVACALAFGGIAVARATPDRAAAHAMHAEAPPTLTFRAPVTFGGEAYALATAGDRAFVGIGRRIVGIQRDPDDGSYITVSEHVVDSEVTAMVAEPGRIWAGDRAGRLTTFDVGEDGALSPSAAIALTEPGAEPHAVTAVAVDGSMAYSVVETVGLVIADAAGGALRSRGRVTASTLGPSIAAVGRTVYGLAGCSIVAIDVDDPDAPTLRLASLKTDGGVPYCWAALGADTQHMQLLVLGQWRASTRGFCDTCGVATLHIRRAAELEWQGWAITGLKDVVRRLSVVNDRALLIAQDAPNWCPFWREDLCHGPIWTGTWLVRERGIWVPVDGFTDSAEIVGGAIAANGDTVYATRHGGLRVIADDAPKTLKRVLPDVTALRLADGTGGRLAIADLRTLHVLERSMRGPWQERSTGPTPSATSLRNGTADWCSLALSDRVLYAGRCDGGGITLFDPASRGTMELLSTIPDAQAKNLAVDGDVLVATIVESGGFASPAEVSVLLVVDVRDRFRPKVVGRIVLPAPVVRLVYRAPYASLVYDHVRGAEVNYGVSVVDISRPDAPVLGPRLFDRRAAHELWLDGDWAVVQDLPSDGWTVYRIDGHAEPTVHHRLPAMGTVVGKWHHMLFVRDGARIAAIDLRVSVETAEPAATVDISSFTAVPVRTWVGALAASAGVLVYGQALGTTYIGVSEGRLEYGALLPWAGR